MSSIYEAPSADLATPQHASGGNVEDAIAGRFEFSATSTISSAWDKLKGFKRSIWLAYLIYMVLTILVAVALGIVMGVAGASPVAGLVTQLVIMAVVMPVMVGMFVLGIKRAAGVEVSGMEVLNFYSKTAKIVAGALLMAILAAIGFVLLIIPGIYLMVSWVFALQLMVEKDMGIWEAMETSRKAVSHCWFGVFGMLILLMLILIVSVIPLGIGMIWSIPLMFLVYGVAYHTIFGYSAKV